MDNLDTVNELKKYAGFFEITHITHFRCFRERQDGGRIQEVTVTIHDAGPEKGDLRYTVVATSEDGSRATGNPAESVHMALGLVHWGDLG